MEKCNLLIFGATEYIYEVAKENLSFSNVNICGFVDNDNNKQGLVFQGKPVYSKTDIRTVQYDYILVGAWASYYSIERELRENGVEDEKIMPLLTRNIYEYMHAAVRVPDLAVMHRIYNDDEVIIESLRKLNEMYDEYIKLMPLEDIESAWYMKDTLIAHACGGYVRGFKCLYSNSKEALEYSLETGFQLIECDLWATSEEFFLAHHASIVWESNGKYTLLCLEEILGILKKYPSVNLLIDIKWAEDDRYLKKPQSLLEYEKIIDKIELQIMKVSIDKTEASQLKSRLILEVYNSATMECAREHNFECIYTQYRNEDSKNFMQVANECVKYGVHGVALYVSLAKDKMKELKLLKEKNLKIFCYSTDIIEEYSMLRTIGVDGVFTNWIIKRR